ncbi:hypothetical protein [Desulfovibrio sp.]|uniref:hypothetical protein n=1 Tax=Desulfovibrio sp. TaxID=885 RepID=UPI003D0E7A72
MRARAKNRQRVLTALRQNVEAGRWKPGVEAGVEAGGMVKAAPSCARTRLPVTVARQKNSAAL